MSRNGKGRGKKGGWRAPRVVPRQDDLQIKEIRKQIKDVRDVVADFTKAFNRVEQRLGQFDEVTTDIGNREAGMDRFGYDQTQPTLREYRKYYLELVKLADRIKQQVEDGFGQASVKFSNAVDEFPPMPHRYEYKGGKKNPERRKGARRGYDDEKPVA